MPKNIVNFSKSLGDIPSQIPKMKNMIGEKTQLSRGVVSNHTHHMYDSPAWVLMKSKAICC